MNLFSKSTAISMDVGTELILGGRVSGYAKPGSDVGSFCCQRCGTKGKSWFVFVAFVSFFVFVSG